MFHQCFDGTSVEFEETEDKLEDFFIITFRDQKEIVATTWCEGEFAEVIITNVSRVPSPIQCGTYSPFHLFIRAVEMRAEETNGDGDSLIDREANSRGLKIAVETNEAQAEVNASRSEMDVKMKKLGLNPKAKRSPLEWHAIK